MESMTLNHSLRVLGNCLESCVVTQFTIETCTFASPDQAAPWTRTAVFGAIRCTVVETHERKFRDRAADFQAMRALIGEKYAPSHVSLDWI